jgi:hypothetical protein
MKHQLNMNENKDIHQRTFYWCKSLNISHHKQQFVAAGTFPFKIEYVEISEATPL